MQMKVRCLTTSTVNIWERCVTGDFVLFSETINVSEKATEKWGEQYILKKHAIVHKKNITSRVASVAETIYEPKLL